MKAPVPESAPEPIVGVKFASVVLVDDRLRFQSTTARAGHARCYDPEQEAVCQLGREHRPPAWDCSCGFYAMADRAGLRAAWQSETEPHWAILTVELSGTVVVHDRGWRGAHQSVLGATFSRRCYGCSRRATGLRMPGRQLEPVRPACQECAGERWSTPAAVAGRVGTDVSLDVVDDGAVEKAAATTGRKWPGRAATARAGMAVGVFVATAIGIVVSGSGRPMAPATDVRQALTAHIDVEHPRETVRRLRAALAPAGLEPTVVEEPGVLLSGGKGQVVSAVVLTPIGVDPSTTDSGAGDASSAGPNPSPPPCQILLTRNVVDSSMWELRTPPAASGQSCLERAVALRAPVTDV